MPEKQALKVSASSTSANISFVTRGEAKTYSTGTWAPAVNDKEIPLSNRGRFEGLVRKASQPVKEKRSK